MSYPTVDDLSNSVHFGSAADQATTHVGLPSIQVSVVNDLVNVYHMGPGNNCKYVH